mmetsp:Transcript_16748/g.54764  ORF Transcript_16748/g.54764 Transcript_16748/m.54764 type:complete len:548 (+) Transcript_16748:25-1668(+)
MPRPVRRPVQQGRRVLAFRALFALAGALLCYEVLAVLSPPPTARGASPVSPYTAAVASAAALEASVAASLHVGEHRGAPTTPIEGGSGAGEAASPGRAAAEDPSSLAELAHSVGTDDVAEAGMAQAESAEESLSLARGALARRCKRQPDGAGAPTQNERLIMSQAQYPAGSNLENHMRVVGAITKATHHGLPEHDPLANVHYRSCAVVASAGIMRLRAYGRAIDQHDAVFRFNSAHTAGMERFVGSRTTLRLVNRENFGWRELEEEMTLQHITTETMLAEFTAAREQRPSERLYGLDPAFYSRVIREGHTHPTNGYFGMKLALELCDCVNLFGFVRRWRGWMTYHYHDDYTPKSSQADRDSSEYPLILELMERNKDRLIFAHPCIIDSQCEGCPDGSRCVEDTPYPVPAPGFCYGHGAPGGRPELKRWTAREYWAGASWEVGAMSSSGAGGGSNGSSGSSTSISGSRRNLLRKKKKQSSPGDDWPSEEEKRAMNAPREGLPYADERRACFRPCAPGEDCPGGPQGVCSDQSVKMHPVCKPWNDLMSE